MRNQKLGSSETEKAPTRRKRFQPALGREFELLDVPASQLDAVSRYRSARTRDLVALVLLGASLAASGVAGAYSLVTGNYVPAAAVWSVVGPIIGAIVAHFFERKDKDTG